MPQDSDNPSRDELRELATLEVIGCLDEVESARLERLYTAKLAMLEAVAVLVLTTVITGAPVSSCSLSAWSHTRMALIPMLSEYHRHRPRRDGCR